MNPEIQQAQQHMRISDAAQRISVSKHFLVLEIKAGKLPVVRLAKRCVRVRAEDLEEYMRRHLFVGPPSNRKPVKEEVAAA